MWFTRVHARAFGALSDQTLELSRGLNVVVGPNESGKSTWHAALYAALYGMPRRDAWTPVEERFAAYRRPRLLEDWMVLAQIELADPRGPRRIEVVQNLQDPAASSVVDVETGETSTAVDGSLDLSRWLGFDRRSYAATSWIEQAGARRALVPTSGRTPLQQAVAACIGEDEVEAGLGRLEEVLRAYIGAESLGAGAKADAAAATERWQRARERVDELRRSRGEAVTRRAQAEGTAEIARKKVLAARAFEARAEADALRASAKQYSDQATADEADAEPTYDTEVHATVALAETELRSVDAEFAALLATTTNADPDAHADVTDDQRPRARRLVGLERFPRLDQIWGLDHVPGLARLGRLEQHSLYQLVAVAALITVGGVVLAFVLKSIIAVVVALAAAVLVLAALAQLTPRPAGPAPDTRPLTSGLILRRAVALNKLASALIARGHDARPTTAEVDYASYLEDCAAAAARAADVDLSKVEGLALEAEQRRVRERELRRAEDRAQEYELAADPYDLRLPYRPSLVDARADEESAVRDLEAARAAVTAIDAQIQAEGTDAAIEARVARAQAQAERVERLEAVLQRARLELTLARESVLRDIASGMAPRVSDYLAQLTDRRFSMAEMRDLQDQIGTSLLRREPELGSFSTTESTFVFTRIALGQHLAGDAQQGPLLVDDITSSADRDRIRRMLSILRRISAQRQVVVFAHQSQVRKWAQRRMTTDDGIRLIRLTAVDQAPEIVTPIAAQ